ncbi:hypothetical protein E3Q23_00426 [Wallemia mellicola]|uniref:Geranylgeranyl transferase type-2 subunit beta n=1 Tax=Wallemia mellicola TaxID=1708541 RepID=A0A4T0S3R6_9BASI|nr:hypothetical protein E3Q23_00426 [Wallemia mellicola]TIB87464.1 terpenoid cyclases/Protein prenyltransferase [Wallemia mellicola]TIB92366.1 terpenoid cyclases/Protein prenyltransferase [Wallemia mellicola]TIB97661.1 terpenoid cyclases/Protein prenyltransferase [Wallemia mellicola]TIC07814.1 terpenoid cyclases/Protein prenyltransferase [Wallemia mellicola]
MLSTLSAIQVLAIHDAIQESGIDTDKVINYILSLRPKNEGFFTGDEWGESDTRFTYCAVSALSLLGALHKLDEKENGVAIKDRIVDWFKQCMNFDGGFGNNISAETHSGQAALAILDRLDIIDRDNLSWWLSERQVESGGLNGRPQKLEDVCYSWWVLSGLSILHRLHWINKEKLMSFILSSQDPDNGGIADRPGDVADVYHTLFGVADTPPPPYENNQRASTSATPRVSDEFAPEDAPLLRQHEEYDEEEELVDDDRTVWERYWAGTFSTFQWKALAHLSVISFPLALFAWIFCFVGSVITASLLITLPIGLGFGWVLLLQSYHFQYF